ncbi:MAG: DUF4386 family protein [Alphaproteobacteria bacterium]|nr:DUF4386 family protein [Alphaproteobacteria bacterium]
MAEQIYTEAPRPFTGAAAIATAIGFNVPFAILGATFEYPDVLRRPAGEVLNLFAQGGAPLILTWHAFAISALALAPLAFALTLTRNRVSDAPGLAIGAAVAGALSALAQAIGLFRWVFVVPGLARVHTDANATEEAKRAAEYTFDLINQYGGVAIGEHLGQLLLALFVVLFSAMQWRERKRISAVLGFVTVGAIVIGTNEGLALALGQSGEEFAMATIGGFVGLTLWLIATGIGTMRGVR